MQKINTKKYESVIKRVLIDHRENNCIDYTLKQYKGLNPHKGHLDVEDYIFHGYNGIQVCFEFKEE